MRPIQLLFVHGWAFAPDFWNPLINFLQGFEIQTINLGYTNKEKTDTKYIEKLLKEQKSTIAIGHSLGFPYLAKEFPHGFAHYIAINSFLKFSKSDDFSSGVPSRILQRMSKGIDIDSQAVLKQFYHQCGYYGEIANLCNKEELKKGLKHLEIDDARNFFKELGDKLTIIASDNDPVVTKEMTKASFGNHPVHWVTDQTHILPISKPELCAEKIKEICLK